MRVEQKLAVFRPNQPHASLSSLVSDHQMYDGVDRRIQKGPSTVSKAESGYLQRKLASRKRIE